MDKLVKQLKEQTQSLKEQYIEMTKKWAYNQYKILVKMSKWGEKQWCEWLGVEPVYINRHSDGFYSFPKGFFNTHEAKTYHNKRNEATRTARMGEKKFIDKVIQKAENHYESSIIKLANRIMKKDLDTDNLKMETSHIGVNIETTISDGHKTVRAFTIIAGGPIQRPHYRYLIK